MILLIRWAAAAPRIADRIIFEKLIQFGSAQGDLTPAGLSGQLACLRDYGLVAGRWSWTSAARSRTHVLLMCLSSWVGRRRLIS